MITEEINNKTEKNVQELRDKIKRGLTNSEREQDEPAGFSGPGVVFGDAPPKRKSEEYLKSIEGWVYACIRPIADSVAKSNLRLFKLDKDGEVTEVLEHPSLDLLYRVNNHQTFFDHMFLTGQYLEGTGEAPWYVDRGESADGEPESILLLRPDRMTFIQNRDKTSDNPVAGYKYKLDLGKEITFKTSEIIFLKYPDPTNPFRGMGTLQAAARTVDVDNYSEDFNLRFFFNSARPDSILKTSGKLTKKQRDDLRADIKKLYSGQKNQQKVAILESGLEWAPMSINQKDMDFLEQQKFTMAKIFSIFGVPKVVAGISDDVNLANAKIGEYTFSKFTVKPKLSRIVAQLNEFYLPMFSGTEKMFLSFDDPVPADIELQLKRYESSLGKGWMTVNEVRAEQNLPDVGPDGDVLLVPVSNQPIGTPPALPAFREVKIAKARKFDLKGYIERSGGGYNMALRRFKAIKQAGKMKDVIDKKVTELVMPMVKQLVKSSLIKKKLKTKEWEDTKKEFADLTLKAGDAYENHFAKGISMYFRKQKSRLLEKFPKKDFKRKQLDPSDYLFDENEEATILVEATQPLIKQIIKEQALRAGKLVGATAFDMATREVQRYLEKNTYKFSFELNEETNRLLADSLAAGIKEGEGIPDLRKRVGELFDGMEKYRSERIARSEVVRASNFATNEAYKQSGVVNKVEWLTAGDPCEYCSPMDGKSIDLGDRFFKKGDSFEGENGGVLNFDYGAVDFPPLHPNCRCTIVPVIN